MDFIGKYMKVIFMQSNTMGLITAPDQMVGIVYIVGSKLKHMQEIVSY